MTCAELPAGTVTFLFSDVEGSTKLVAQLCSRFVEVIEPHHEIVRIAIATGAGVEVTTEGDSFFAAFPIVTGAVRAAVAAQRALAAESWSHGGELRVRMGLHTGEGARAATHT